MNFLTPTNPSRFSRMPVCAHSYMTSVDAAFHHLSVVVAPTAREPLGKVFFVIKGVSEH